MDCLQLDLLLNLNHLLRANQNRTDQWEHFLRATNDTCDTVLRTKPHSFTKICFNSKDPTSNQDVLLGGHYYKTKYPPESDPEKSWLQITSTNGEKFFAEATHSGMAQRGGNRIMTLNARTSGTFERWTKQFPFRFTSQFRRVR
jgi:hypothetical protein